GKIIGAGVDHVVGGQDVEHRIFVAGNGQMGGSGNGGGGVARHRLEQDGTGFNANQLRLFGDEEAVFGIGDDNGGAIAARIADPHQAPLEQAVTPDEIDE